MANRDRTRNPWPFGVVVLGVVAVAALVTSVVYGVRHVSRVSDPRYYVRGLEHDARLKARDGRLAVVVVDRVTAPVTGARVRVVFLGPDGLPARTATAVEGPLGTYALDLPPPGPNPTARLEVERGDVRMVQPLLLAR